MLFFGFHSIFAILDPSGKRLAVAGNTGPIGVDHLGIRDHHFQLIFSLADGDNVASSRTPEVKEYEPIWHAQCVLVLRGEGRAAQDH